jgi:hypothetical protein
MSNFCTIEYILYTKTNQCVEDVYKTMRRIYLTHIAISSVSFVNIMWLVRRLALILSDGRLFCRTFCCLNLNCLGVHSLMVYVFMVLSHGILMVGWLIGSETRVS